MTVISKGPSCIDADVPVIELYCCVVNVREKGHPDKLAAFAIDTNGTSPSAKDEITCLNMMAEMPVGPNFLPATFG